MRRPALLWSALFLGRLKLDEPPSAPRAAGSLTAGVRWIRHNPIIRAELLGLATLNFFNFIFFALFVLYATRTLGVNAATLGIVLGTASVGTLDIMAGTISASLIPPALRSRVSGAFNVVNYGVRPLGTAAGGVLGSLIGLRPTLWIATVGALAGLLFILPSPIMRLRELPEEALVP
jgi:MFS family permease